MLEQTPEQFSKLNAPGIATAEVLGGYHVTRKRVRSLELLFSVTLEQNDTLDLLLQPVPGSELNELLNYRHAPSQA